MKKLIALLVVAGVIFVNIGVIGCNGPESKTTVKQAGSGETKTTAK